jgi:hypothetical protein
LRRRRAFEVELEIRSLACAADSGRLVGARMVGDPRPTGEVSFTEADAYLVAGELRRCAEHLRLHGLPPSGGGIAVGTLGSRVDSLDELIALAPVSVTFSELSRIVVALTERTTFTLTEARTLAAHIAHRASDFDQDVALVPQLFPSRPADGGAGAADVPEEKSPALSLVPALPATAPTNDRPAWRPVGLPPWGEP